MVAVIALFASLPLAFIFPGITIPAIFFGYIIGALVGFEQTTTLYTASALAVLLARALLVPVRIKLTAIDLAFVAFLGWSAMTSTYTLSPEIGAAAAGDLALSAGSIYLVSRLVGAMGDPRQRLAEIVVGFCIIGGFAGISAIFAGQVVNGRLLVGSATEVGVAQAFPYLAIAGLGLLLLPNRRRAWHFMLGGLALALGTYVSLVSGTRGNVLAVGAAAVFMLAISHQLAVLRATLIVAAIAAVASLYDFSAVSASLGRILDFGAYGGSTDASSSVRRDLYSIAYQMFEASPLIGQGIGSFLYQTGQPYPHNIMLQIMAETGLVGTLIFLALVVVAYRQILSANALKLDWVGPTLISFMIAGMVQYQVSLPLSAAKSLFIVGLLAGLPAIQTLSQGRKSRTKPGLVALVQQHAEQRS